MPGTASEESGDSGESAGDKDNISSADWWDAVWKLCLEKEPGMPG